MQKDLVYATVTYNRPAELKQAIHAVLDSSLLPNTMVIIDNSPESYANGIVEEIKSTRTVPIMIGVFAYPQNIGLVGAWNKVLQTFDDYVILANDDVIPDHITIEVMYKTALYSNSNEAVIFGAKDAYSFFIIKKSIYNEIGGWDELFWPVYYDDGDVDYRVKLLGYKTIMAPNATFTHAENGSATVKAYDSAALQQHHERFRSNLSYYLDKWGGEPNYELYRIPFNGDESKEKEAKARKQAQIDSTRA